MEIDVNEIRKEETEKLRKNLQPIVNEVKEGIRSKVKAKNTSYQYEFKKFFPGYSEDDVINQLMILLESPNLIVRRKSKTITITWSFDDDNYYEREYDRIVKERYQKKLKDADKRIERAVENMDSAMTTARMTEKENWSLRANINKLAKDQAKELVQEKHQELLDEMLLDVLNLISDAIDNDGYHKPNFKSRNEEVARVVNKMLHTLNQHKRNYSHLEDMLNDEVDSRNRQDEKINSLERDCSTLNACLASWKKTCSHLSNENNSFKKELAKLKSRRLFDRIANK